VAGGNGVVLDGRVGGCDHRSTAHSNGAAVGVKDVGVDDRGGIDNIDQVVTRVGGGCGQRTVGQAASAGGIEIDPVAGAGKGQLIQVHGAAIGAQDEVGKADVGGGEAAGALNRHSAAAGESIAGRGQAAVGHNGPAIARQVGACFKSQRVTHRDSTMTYQAMVTGRNDAGAGAGEVQRIQVYLKCS